MFKIRTAARLAIVITMIVNANVWLGIMLRMTPDPDRALLDSRYRVAELLSLTAGTYAETNRIREFERMMTGYLAHNEDIVSIGLRGRHDSYRFLVGPHAQNWELDCQDATQSKIDILANGRHWGTLELRFAEIERPSGLFAYFQFPYSLVLFVSSLTGLISWLTFTQTFKYLNPSKVVPGRVRNALDSLAEGLVLLDRDYNIVHCNHAFLSMVNRDDEDLVAEPIAQFPWQFGALIEAPWKKCLDNAEPARGVLAELNVEGAVQKYSVNANAIQDGSGKPRGVLVSFDNVTLLEQKKEDLAKMIDSLRHSRDEIKKQNAQLKFLASRDPLTKCYNRRSFWELFEHYWAQCPKGMLNIIMVDIDHFKSINDNYGHSKGDDVLRETGSMLLRLVGNHGLVCRYGGEEIAILLPNIDFDDAVCVANGLHQAFNSCLIGGLQVTASIGISNRNFGSMDTQHLLDQADQCLYYAKKHGRNQVVRFDQIETEGGEEAEKTDAIASVESLKVSYSNAMALFSALAYRDIEAAKHGLQLADLCVCVGRKRLDPRMLYLLEIAALLHEVGQLGTSKLDRQILVADGKLNSSAYRDLLTMSSEIARSALGNRVLKSIFLEFNPQDKNIVDLPEEAKSDLQACGEIFHTCEHFLHEVNQTGRVNAESLTQTINKVKESLADQGQVQWLQPLFENTDAVIEILERPSQVQIEFDEDSAAIVADHIEELCSSLAEKDISKLRKIVGDLHRDASRFKPSVVTDAVGQLHQAIEKRGAEFDDLIDLADQLLDLCRLNRKGVVQTAISADWKQALTRIHSQGEDKPLIN
ncbi:MAG: GGDEF domain-containing protein [Pirellulaceae bacterium]